LEERKMEKDYRKEFINTMLEVNSLKFGEFITKSGRKSPYFVNIGAFDTGDSIKKLGEFYAMRIKEAMDAGELDKNASILFGTAYKGISLVVSTAIALKVLYGLDFSYCFNRKEEKTHGEGGDLVGYQPKPGDSVLIIDDVITAGTAMGEITPMITNIGAKISGLVVSVDRMEKFKPKGGEPMEISAVSALLEQDKIKTFSIVSIQDIVEILKGDVIDEGLVERIYAYMSEHCV
jgi:orotate phosphoribosyltransferase